MRLRRSTCLFYCRNTSLLLRTGRLGLCSNDVFWDLPKTRSLLNTGRSFSSLLATKSIQCGLYQSKAGNLSFQFNCMWMTSKSPRALAGHFPTWCFPGRLRLSLVVLFTQSSIFAVCRLQLVVQILFQRCCGLLLYSRTSSGLGLIPALIFMVEIYETAAWNYALGLGVATSRDLTGLTLEVRPLDNWRSGQPCTSTWTVPLRGSSFLGCAVVPRTRAALTSGGFSRAMVWFGLVMWRILAVAVLSQREKTIQNR